MWLEEAMSMSGEEALKQMLKNREWQQAMETLDAPQRNALIRHMMPAKPSEAMREATKEASTVGMTVLIGDLVTRSDLNARLGKVVTSLNTTTGRVGVEMLASEESVKIRMRNLTPITPEDLPEVVNALFRVDVKLFKKHWNLDPCKLCERPSSNADIRHQPSIAAIPNPKTFNQDDQDRAQSRADAARD